MAVAPPRRRPRRGSLERPVSGRIYRTAWLAAAVPLLVAAFSLGRPVALQQPRLPASFDRTTAVQFAKEFAHRNPDRRPGSSGARRATDWVAARLHDYKFTVERQEFTANVPGLGRQRFVNLVATAPFRPGQEIVRSQQVIVVMAHRDNLGGSPGANDNASGTGALLELARDVGSSALAHSLVLVSEDGGAYGSVGAEEFARNSGLGNRLAVVINLDAIAGSGPPRLEFAGETPRTPTATLVATAAATVEAQAHQAPRRPSAAAQLVDLAFPFTLYAQGPFIAHGVPAVTLTSAGARPPQPAGDTPPNLNAQRLGEMGKAAQTLLGSLDEAADVARGTESYVWVGSRLVRGWTIQFLFLTALLPFLAAVVDLFARCRRRHIALRPALRSLVSRLGVWLWAGALFAFLAFTGILPRGDARPIALNTQVAGDWPVAGLFALAGLSFVGWLVARPKLVPRRSITRPEELGGHLAAMLVLGIVALVVAAQNPFALLFVLPSLHAWLWLPHASDRGRPAALGLYALGFGGPLVLLASFALRFHLGFDALWYVLALTSIGYVPVPLVLAFLAWTAVAAQTGAVAIGRYAPYPAVHERPRRGPIRETIRQVIFLTRRLRSERGRSIEPAEEAEALEE
ncbi:MAG TPA: M28 family peptidase [Gaiellaceae bacterium]|nr:M28 family peptidase [Gaiellaceae bacterium]